MDLTNDSYLTRKNDSNSKSQSQVNGLPIIGIMKKRIIYSLPHEYMINEAMSFPSI